jgi:hypothetical protein
LLFLPKTKIMRQNLLLILFSCLSSIIWGQVPQGIPYQAVARDAQGNPMANQSLTVQFSLHEASADGQVVYQETQTSSTNAQGLFSLTFGAGVPSVGTFASINWGSGYKFLQVQANFGSGYVDVGTQQLMSVPYALYSGSSGNGNNQSNSNYNPSADSVLTLIDKRILLNGVYTVPQGEIWEIESMNIIDGQVTRDFISCQTISSSTLQCTYYISNPPVKFSLNNWVFNSTVSNYSVKTQSIPIDFQGSDYCSLCASQFTQGFNYPVPDINLPIHAVAGDVLTLNGVRLAISKYK